MSVRDALGTRVRDMIAAFERGEPVPAANRNALIDDLAAWQATRIEAYGRLTTPRDVANVVYLLSLDEAAWINGALIRVDGGEHVSGASS